MTLPFLNRGQAISAALAATLLPARAVQAQGTPGLTVMRVASGPTDQVAPLLYAINAGLFRASGLDVSVTQMRNGAEVASAVLGGSLEVGAADVVVSLLAHAKGVPITLVAPTLFYDVSNQNVGMLVSATSTIASAKDLRGKTIGINGLSNSFALATMAWLDRAGIDPLNSVKFTEIPAPATAAALAEGRVDGAVAYEPIMSDAVAQGARVIGYPFEAFGHRSEPSAYFSSLAWVAAHPKELRAFRDVLRVAGQYTSAHETDIFPLTAKFTGLPLAMIAKMKPSVRAYALDPALIQPYIDAAVKYKFIAQRFSAKDMIS